VLFDSDRRIMVVEDPTDHAKPIPLSDPKADPGAGAADWQSLEQLATRPGTTEQDFDDALLATLRRAPRLTVERIRRELGAVGQPDPEAKGETGSVTPDATASIDTATASIDTFEGQFSVALEATALPRRMRQAVTALISGAIQTARSHLGQLDGKTRLLAAKPDEDQRQREEREEKEKEYRARVALLEAVVESLAAERDVKEAAKILKGEGRQPPERCADAVAHAHALDKGYTDSWLRQLEQAGLERAVGSLLRGLRDLEEEAEPEHRAVLLARAAVEAAGIATSLEQAAAKLSDDGEPLVTAFAKLGLALEDTFLAECVGGARPAAVNLVETLTQQQQPKLGGG